jgi:hypothetical protein
MEYGQHVFGLEGDAELWQQHLSTLQKSKQPMPTEVHDHVDGDDDNDDSLPQKFTSSNFHQCHRT